MEGASPQGNRRTPGGRSLWVRARGGAGAAGRGWLWAAPMASLMSLESQPQYYLWCVCVCVCACGVCVWVRARVRARPASSQPSKLALHPQARLCPEQRWDPEVREADAPQTCHPHTGVCRHPDPQQPGGQGRLGQWAMDGGCISMQDPRGGGEATQGHGGRTRAQATG